MVTTVEQIPLQDQAVLDRRMRRHDSEHAQIWSLLDGVTDPEIPVLSLWDLGVLQDVIVQGDTVVVCITPTYSGCPAIAVMTQDIVACLAAAGYGQVRVEQTLTPVWGTRFLSRAAREKLRAFQIAPPGGLSCPNCGSDQAELISEFSSTACKALYRCQACAEPFDYFKPH